MASAGRSLLSLVTLVVSHSLFKTSPLNSPRGFTTLFLFTSLLNLFLKRCFFAEILAQIDIIENFIVLCCRGFKIDKREENREVKYV